MMSRWWLIGLFLMPVFVQALTVERSMLRLPHDIPSTYDQVVNAQDWQEVEQFGTHGFSTDIFWLRLKLIAKEDSHFVLKLVYPIHDLVDIYEFKDGQLKQDWQMGDARPAPQWQFIDKHFSIPLHLTGNQPHEVLIRIEGFNSKVLETRVLTREEFDRESLIGNVLIGAFFGMLLVMALYNLSLAFITQDPAYFIYVAYVLGFCFLAVSLSGDGYHLIWTGYPNFNHYSISIAGGLLAFPTVLFPYVLLNISQNAPQLKIIFRGMLFIASIYLVSLPFMSVAVSLKAINIMNLVFMMILLGTGIYLSVKRVPVAWIYTLAWSFLIAGLIVLSLAAYNLLPMNDVTRQANLVGGLVEMVLLSIALALRVRYERKAREDALEDALIAQEEVAKSRLRFDELFREAPIGIFQLNDKGEPIAVNPALVRLLGYQSESEALALGANITHHFENPQGLTDRLVQFGKVVDHETELKSRNGESVFCSLSMRAFKENNRSVVEGFITDISERKHAQQIHDIMEKERIASVGQLVAGVAHEINTPLGINVTSVSHVKELLNDIDSAMDGNALTKSQFKSFITDMESLMDIMGDNLSHMAVLVSRFKALSISNLDVEKAYTNMYEQLYAAMAGQFTLDESVAYDIECDKEALLETYPGAWHIIVSQLVENSVVHGFTSQSEKKISIQFIKLDDYLWRFVYRDNGKGISEDIVDKIFEPFFTTRRSNKNNAGLGLYRVFNLVRQVLKGDIEVLKESGFALQIDFECLSQQASAQTDKKQ